ncbi:unnamed protein product [Symbiodinium pilosum]|uniref:Uncharacterized protein n=1 Tax=Symbiodinium pilosum TaxID=2952 RepID=A0A812MR82_SYMPI|nr:unnamed protein product [Symbiodinium pilosum]
MMPRGTRPVTAQVKQAMILRVQVLRPPRRARRARRTKRIRQPERKTQSAARQRARSPPSLHPQRQAPPRKRSRKLARSCPSSSASRLGLVRSMPVDWRRQCIGSWRQAILLNLPSSYIVWRGFIPRVMTTGSKRNVDHNFLGSSYLSRFLFSVLLARTYLRKKAILHNLLDAWASDLKECYENGIPVKNVPGMDKIYPVIIACKGDWPALTKAGRLCRHHLRDSRGNTDSPPGICHLCRAGQKNFRWNEFRSDARWLHADNPLPWNIPSPLSRIPQNPNDLAGFYAVDLFHVCHKVVVADYVASAIVTLSDQGCLGSGAFETRMQRFYDDAKEWRWFKGADTTLLALYLETFYAKILADCSEEVENVLTVIYDGLVAVNRFMTASYHEALWVKSHRASEISVQGMAFMEWFNEAAMEALRQEVTSWAA